ncbi:MAG: response regulator [Anaerolineae bacterium]|nr:response regulator [Anaerolineae bacterium]
MAGLSILIVDDDIDTLTVLSLHLERAAFAVRWAINEQQALRAIEDHLPNVLLIDEMLPQRDGLEVVRRVRARYSKETLPIIMLSALGDIPEERGAGFHAGVNAYLSKPYRRDELLHQVKTLIAPSHGYFDLKNAYSEDSK